MSPSITDQVEQQLSPPAEYPSQQPRHGENNVSMRNGRKHFLLQPLGPQELLLFLARRAEAPAATRKLRARLGCRTLESR